MRSSWNSRLVNIPLHGSLARIVLRAIGMLLNAITYAIAARSLSPEDMGIWALATALTTITLSLDLGLSSTLRNRLASKPAQGPIYFQEVFTLSFILSLAYSALILAAACISFTLPWPSLDWWTPLRQTTAIALVTGFGLILLRLPFNLATNSFYSYNEPDFPIYWEVFNFTASFLLIVVVVLIDSGSVQLTAAFLLGGTLTGLGGTVHFLRRRGWRLRLTWPKEARSWISSGASFGFLQLVGLGLSTLPAFMIGLLVKVEDVTLARACMILCQAILSLHLAHAMPIWTEFTQLRGDPNCQGRLLVLKGRMRSESALLIVIFIGLALVMPWGIGIWLNGHADYLVTTTFCIWGAGLGVCNLYSLILNGGDRPLLTATALLPGAFFSSFSTWILAPNMGSQGVALSFALGAVLSALVMILLAYNVMNSVQAEYQSKSF